MPKIPNSSTKPVKREGPMNATMKFFLAGCVAELYLLVVRKYYINGTLTQVIAWDSYLRYILWAGVAVLAIGVILSIVWHKDRKKRVIVIDGRYRVVVFFWRMIPRWLWERLPIKN